MNLSPLPIQKFFDNNGRPLTGGLLFTYTAGTSTKVATYSDEAGTPNTNPVVLNFRGEANVWLDQTLTYKFVLSPADDTDPPTRPIWSVDNISAAITFASLTAQIIGQILYPMTSAERNAAVTVVNWFYPSGVVDRYGTNTTPGTTDMTTAIHAAKSVAVQSNGPALTFLPGLYLCTDTAIEITSADARISVQGTPLRSIILNKASANKPTISLLGAQYWDITGLVLIGATSFPNIGIDFAADGIGNRCAFGTMDQIVCQTNGGGIRIRDTNTIAISNYDYWPSGGSSFGGTIDANGQPYGILADGTSAVNSVCLRNINISGVNTIANGGCRLKIDGSASAAPFQDWRLDTIEVEGGTPATERGIWMRNVYNSNLQNVFSENAEVRIDWGSSQNEICIQAGASGTLVLDGSTGGGGCAYTHIHDSVGLSFTADAANVSTLQVNNRWQVAPGDSDASSPKTRIATYTTGGALEADLLNFPWITEAFSAGNYTASSGNWTVASGDEVTREYSITGTKTATVNFYVKTTTVSATPAFLFMALPGSMQSKKEMRIPFLYSEDNGTTTNTGVAYLQASSNQLALAKDLASTAWATTADLTLVSFSATFEIN